MIGISYQWTLKILWLDKEEMCVAKVIDSHKQIGRQIINGQVNKGSQILRMNNKYGHNPYSQ